MTEVDYLTRADAGVLTITLCSARTANAITDEVGYRLSGEIEEAGSDSTTRAIVLTGAGSTFCSGADLTERANAADRGASEGNIALYRAVLNVPKVVVAAVNGHARAGGVALVAAADIAICSDVATFGVPEVHRGLVPAVVSVSMQACLAHRAMQRYLLTGEVFDAAEAMRIGLVSQTVPRPALESTVHGVLNSLRLGAPSAVSATKQLLDETTGIDREALYRSRAALSSRFYRLPDALEGMRAFLEKRPPAWGDVR